MARDWRWIIGRISEGSDFAGSPEYKAPTGWIWNARQADDWGPGETDTVDEEVRRLTALTGRPCYRVVRLEPLPVVVAPEKDAGRPVSWR